MWDLIKRKLQRGVEEKPEPPMYSSNRSVNNFEIVFSPLKGARIGSILLDAHKMASLSQARVTFTHNGYEFNVNSYDSQGDLNDKESSYIQYLEEKVARP